MFAIHKFVIAGTIEVPCADVNIAPCDQLKLSGGAVTPMTVASEAPTFAGSAYTQKRAGDGQTTMLIYPPDQRNVFEVSLDAATDVAVGDLFAWSGKQQVTKTPTNAIFVAIQAGTQLTSVLGVYLCGAAVAALTDSTTGVAGNTLIALRTDTAAHVAADSIVNFASLAAQVEAMRKALRTRGIC